MTTKRTNLLPSTDAANSEFGQPAKFCTIKSNSVFQTAPSNFGTVEFGSDLPSFEKLAKKAKVMKANYCYDHNKNAAELTIKINFHRPGFGQIDWQK